MDAVTIDAGIEGELLALGASFVYELAGRLPAPVDDVRWSLLHLQARGAVRRYEIRRGLPWRRRTTAVVYQLTPRRARQLKRSPHWDATL
jgi:hypothetical protein